MKKVTKSSKATGKIRHFAASQCSKFFWKFSHSTILGHEWIFGILSCMPTIACFLVIVVQLVSLSAVTGEGPNRIVANLITTSSPCLQTLINIYTGRAYNPTILLDLNVSTQSPIHGCRNGMGCPHHFFKASPRAIKNGHGYKECIP